MKKEMTLKNISMITQEVLERAQNLQSKIATVIALSGELGSGKTTLTQQIAKELGVKENINSPTYVILKNYELPSTEYKWRKLIHIDAYRLNKSEELMNLAWEEILKDKTNLIIIEWPEQVPECIPKNALYIELTHVKEDTRTIEFKA